MDVTVHQPWLKVQQTSLVLFRGIENTISFAFFDNTTEKDYDSTDVVGNSFKTSWELSNYNNRFTSNIHISNKNIIHVSKETVQ